MEIKCKLLKRGFLEHTNYTVFTTTISKAATLFEIPVFDRIHHNEQEIIVNCYSNNYKIDGSDLILNNLELEHEDSQILGLINLYNKAEGVVKEKIGQLGVTFIVDLVPAKEPELVNDVPDNVFEETF